MKKVVRNLIIFSAIASSAQAVTLVDATFTTDTNYPNSSAGQFFLDETDATWTINSGVTVTGGRYFIGMNSGSSSAPANWTIDGGGTLVINRDGFLNLRLGNGSTSEIGTLTIKEGSSVLMTGATPSLSTSKSGSFVALEGVGSTLQWSGTWDAVNNRIISDGGTDLTFSGGTLDISTNGGFTTATVVAAVPEPSATALLGIAGVTLILRRRR
ncbi:PEP-CTERM sorting domain-containing protein [Rubritalea tangerina]|uniref:PEP-CTERM sorting domain-containing protein n=1 Tax=Rubritalea tangerina TaxID=430798 RepID=A0ABW4Z9I3_9BACT